MALLNMLLGPVLDKALDFIPNPSEKQRRKLDMERDLLKAISSANIAQIKVNEAEAVHKSLFVAGWRPFIGWTCGAGIAWNFIAQPLLGWFIIIWYPDIEFPVLDTGPLFGLVTAMLGLGGLRTFEKFKGVQRDK